MFEQLRLTAKASAGASNLLKLDLSSEREKEQSRDGSLENFQAGKIILDGILNT
jgi:hypothetical protein